MAASRTSSIPVFRNVAKIKGTPRRPIIPYFTAKQWKAVVKRHKPNPKGKIDRKHPVVRYQLAPWGNGDVIMYHDMNLISRLKIKCKPRFRVIGPHQGGPRVIFYGWECKPKALGSCELIIHAGAGQIPDPPFSCDGENCNGSCEMIWVGDQNGGEVQCVCR